MKTRIIFLSLALLMIMQTNVGKMRYLYGLMDAEVNILIPAVHDAEIYYSRNVVSDVELNFGDESWFVGDRGTLIPKSEYVLAEKHEALNPVVSNGKYGY